jgi:uncharacterized protein (TIGR03492 family)
MGSQPPRLIIVSNGHGEDAIGATLGRLLEREGIEVEALPLVGRGSAYERAGLPVLGPRQEMPSGGMVYLRPGVFWRDLRAGWWSMSRAQWNALRASPAEMTLVVGDLYALAVGLIWGSRPLVQIQPLVSVRYRELPRDWQRLSAQHFTAFERWGMRRALRVYVRDEESARWLRARGVPQAVWVGNPLMDALEEGPDLDLPPPYLLLLPGSRADAYFSLPLMLKALELIEVPWIPLVAWANLPLEPLATPGWERVPTGAKEGVTHRLIHRDRVVYLAQGAFRSALLGAQLALSTSGSAAEQAAGYGVPLIGFPTPGPQFTPSFARAQAQLLGGALRLVPPRPEAIARALQAFLVDPEALAQAQEAGRAAMGPPGACERIAGELARLLERL